MQLLQVDLFERVEALVSLKKAHPGFVRLLLRGGTVPARVRVAVLNGVVSTARILLIPEPCKCTARRADLALHPAALLLLKLVELSRVHVDRLLLLLDLRTEQLLRVVGRFLVDVSRELERTLALQVVPPLVRARAECVLDQGRLLRDAAEGQDIGGWVKGSCNVIQVVLCKLILDLLRLVLVDLSQNLVGLFHVLQLIERHFF